MLARSLTLRAARRSNRLTEFDGDLSAAGVPRLTRPVSPTQLQTWAACPHAYFVQYLLGVRAVEEPGDEVAITPIDRGNVLHDVLDRFHREVIAGQLPQPDEHGWSEAHRTRLVELFDDTAARFEHSGRTGRAAYWEIDRQRLLHDLMFWFDSDSAHVAARGARVDRLRAALRGRRRCHASRSPMGVGSRCYGSVDRIDRTTTGLVVTDHKVGLRPDVQQDRPCRSDVRRHSVPAARLRRCRERDRRRARPTSRSRAGPRRVLVLRTRRVRAHRLRPRRRRLGTGREPTCSTWCPGIEAGWFPAIGRQAEVPGPRRMPVLRARLARHRRAVRRMGTQTARPAPRATGSRPSEDERADDNRPPDQADRNRIQRELDRNLFVEAGAGAGKTSSLVGRIVELVRSGVPIEGIAAITFTEKAAADLRHRLRATLQRAAADEPSSPDESARFEAALDDLDHAPIGTLHAFARRLLNEFPVGGRAATRLRRARRAREQPRLRGTLGRPARTAARASAPGRRGARGWRRPGAAVRLRRVRAAQDVSSCRRRLPRELGSRGSACRHHRTPRVVRSTSPTWPRSSSRRARSRRRPTTRRPVSWRDLGRWAADPALRYDDDRAADDVRRDRQALRAAPAATATRPSGAATEATQRSQHLRDRELEIHAEAERQLESARTPPGSARRRDPRGGGCSSSAGARAADGTVEFHDLLVLARRLLSNHGPRSAPHSTAGTSACCSTSSRTPTRSSSRSRCAWRRRPTIRRSRPTGPTSCRCPAGCSSSATRSSRSTGSAVPTSRSTSAPPTRSVPTAPRSRANFRSSAPVIRWVNHVFGALIEAQPDTQPAFQPLDACRPDHLEHGSVRLLGVARARRPRSAEGARRRPALARGGRRRRCRRHGSPRTLAGDRSGHARAARVPAGRHHDPAPGTHVAGRARGGVGRARHSRTAPRTARSCTRPPTSATSMLALRAADDSTDELALIAALRSGLYGCSDVELLDWRTRGGSWSIWRQPPDGLVGTSRGGGDRPRAFARRAFDVVVARRPDRGPRRRAPARRRRARLARCARRLAPHQLRGRAGPRVERRRRSRPAALPRVGAAASGREPHRRHDPARTRLRRGPDHDDPRRQGARVPDHGRHRADHRADRAVRLLGRVAQRHVDDRQQAGRRHLRRLQADRRADERRRAASPALRGVHACGRPPRRVAPPCAAQARRRRPTRCRAPRCWRRAGAADAAAGAQRVRCQPGWLHDPARWLPTSSSGATSRHGRPSASGPCASPGAGSRSAPRDSPRTSCVERPGRGSRRRPPQGRRRPRAPAVAARALRHGRRPRRARHAAVLRPRGRPRHRRLGGRRSARPRASSDSRRRSPRSPARRWRHRPCGRR